MPTFLPRLPVENLTGTLRQLYQLIIAREALVTEIHESRQLKACRDRLAWLDWKAYRDLRPLAAFTAK